MDILQKTLQWVNQARQEMGLMPLEKLPKGISGHSNACPVARALRGYVGPDAIWYWEKKGGRDYAYSVANAWDREVKEVPNQCGDTAYIVYLPEEIQEFVRRFDADQYPELVQWW